MKKFTILLIFLLLCPSATYAKEIIFITGVKDTKDSFNHFVEVMGGDPIKIANFDSVHASRPVLALLMIQQALNAAGIDAEYKYKPYPNYSRALKELKRGKAHILASDIWENRFDDSVYKTAPFVRKGEFEKGIYTYENSALLSITPDLNELLKYKPITGMSWDIDLKLLSEMGFNAPMTAPTYPLLLKMLARQRADFTLLEFNKNRNIIPIGEDILYLVRGIKVAFPYSRHFMVSKKSEGGKRIYEALEKGLKMLRENGIIEKALSQSGFKNKEVKDWKIIYPQEASNLK